MCRTLHQRFLCTALLAMAISGGMAGATVQIAQLQSLLKAGQYANLIKRIDAGLPTSPAAIVPELYILKGQALMAEKLYASAALDFLRAPFNYPGNVSAAAQGLLSAAQIEAGPLKDPASAKKLLQMLIADYPNTPEAKQARQLLQ